MSNDSIGDALEITTSDGRDEITLLDNRDVEVVKNSREEKTDIKRDYEYTRGQLYSLIEKVKRIHRWDHGNLTRNWVCKGQSYEVTGQIIKSVI